MDNSNAVVGKFPDWFNEKCKCWYCETLRVGRNGSVGWRTDLQWINAGWNSPPHPDRGDYGHAHVAPDQKPATADNQGLPMSDVRRWYNPQCGCKTCHWVRMVGGSDRVFELYPQHGESTTHPRDWEARWPAFCKSRAAQGLPCSAHIDPPGAEKEIENVKNDKRLYSVSVYRNLAAGEEEATVLVQPTEVFAKGPQHATLQATKLVPDDGYNIGTDTVRLVEQSIPNVGG